MVAARDEIVRLFVADVVVARALRAVVFVPTRTPPVRPPVDLTVVFTRCCDADAARAVALPSRTAASAIPMHSIHEHKNDRIFFISD